MNHTPLTSPISAPYTEALPQSERRPGLPRDKIIALEETDENESHDESRRGMEALDDASRPPATILSHSHLTAGPGVGQYDHSVDVLVDIASPSFPRSRVEPSAAAPSSSSGPLAFPSQAVTQPSFNQHLDSGIRFLNRASQHVIDLPPVYTEN